MNLYLKSISKSIKGEKVLDDISYTFESGKIYGIYGKNGSGKTMLLRAIAGFINTDKGYIKYNHKALHKDMDVLPDLGAVIENISFWSMYSGFENLKMLSNIKGIVSDEEIYEIMIYFGLDPKSKKKVNKYSLGMRQKLALCQALMEHPKILLLDEPTNALDQHSIDLFRERILEEKKNDTITILTSHNKEDIESNYSLDDMEKDSSLIARITVTNSREMSLRSTKTMVKIEEIYKDNSANLSVGDCIYIIEPVSFVRGEEFYTNGWQYLKTEDTYLIFLKNLGCIDGYKYTKEEENSFMPVSEIYSKRNLTHDESLIRRKLSIQVYLCLHF